MVDLHKKEHAFGAFTIGVAVGVGAALLFGTEDGRKLAKKILDNLPEKIKNLSSQQPSEVEDQSTFTPPVYPETTPHTYIPQDTPPQFS